MLNNHLRITVLYHRDPVQGTTQLDDLEVDAFSIKHSYEGGWNSGGAAVLLLRSPLRPTQIHSLSLPACLLRLAALAACADSARACCFPTRLCALTGKKPVLKTCDPSFERVVTESGDRSPWEKVRRSSTPTTSDSRCAALRIALYCCHDAKPSSMHYGMHADHADPARGLVVAYSPPLANHVCERSPTSTPQPGIQTHRFNCPGICWSCLDRQVS